MQLVTCPYCSTTGLLNHKIVVQFEADDITILPVLDTEIGTEAPSLPMLGAVQLKHMQQLFITRDFGERGSSRFMPFGSEGVLIGVEAKSDLLVADFSGEILCVGPEWSSTTLTTLPAETAVYALKPVLVKESSTIAAVVIVPGTKGEIVGTTTQPGHIVVKFAHPNVISATTVDSSKVGVACTADVTNYAKVSP